MSFFRNERPFSPFFRHDPFTPFFPRSSFQSPFAPISRVFDSPYYSPFSPFITVFEEPRTSRYDRDHSQSQSSSTKAVEASPSSQSNSTSQSNSSPSTQSQGKEMTQSSQSNDTGMQTQSGGRRHHRHGRPQQQMSLWSPFTGSLFPSSAFDSALAPLSQAMRAMPEITLDMFSTPQSYSIHASVPGMEKKDIKVTVEDGVLTIQAERKENRKPSKTTSTTSSSSSPSPSTQGATSQGGSSTTTTGSTFGSQQSSGSPTGSQQPSAEMKYPTEEKEEKGASSINKSSPSASSTSTDMKDGSVPNGSSVQSSGSSGSTNGMEVEDDDEVDFHHVESFYGRVERSVQLPEDAKVDDLSAHYENGILKIEIPRIQEQKRGRRIEIQ